MSRSARSARPLADITDDGFDRRAALVQDGGECHVDVQEGVVQTAETGGERAGRLTDGSRAAQPFAYPLHIGGGNEVVERPRSDSSSPAPINRTAAGLT